MPLRDHFHTPEIELEGWDALHGGWPMNMVRQINLHLPTQFVAHPQVHLGSEVELDVATFESDHQPVFDSDQNGAVATEVWASPQPTLDLKANLTNIDEYEVRIYDVLRGRTLVAVVELVSPANKDRSLHRDAFVSKCFAFLQQKVSVSIIDVVTERSANLFFELMERIGRPITKRKASPIYAVTCRTIEQKKKERFQAWEHLLAIGKPLPTLPIWLTEELAIPLELEASYEETCKDLRIP